MACTSAAGCVLREAGRKRQRNERQRNGSRGRGHFGKKFPVFPDVSTYFLIFADQMGKNTSSWAGNPQVTAANRAYPRITAGNGGKEKNSAGPVMIGDGSGRISLPLESNGVGRGVLAAQVVESPHAAKSVDEKSPKVRQSPSKSAFARWRVGEEAGTECKRVRALPLGKADARSRNVTEIERKIRILFAFCSHNFIFLFFRGEFQRQAKSSGLIRGRSISKLSRFVC